MRWEDVRLRFPDQWLELIPMEACEKYGKQYVDEVAIAKVLDADALPDGPYTKHPGYISFAYHTKHRWIVLDEDTLPNYLSGMWKVVHKHDGLLDAIYDEGYAVGMLEVGCSVETVADVRHMPIELVQEIKSKYEAEHGSQVWEEKRKESELGKMARRMLAEGMDVALVSKVTGLSLEGVQSLLAH